MLYLLILPKYKLIGNDLYNILYLLLNLIILVVE